MDVYTSLDASAPTLQGVVGGAYSSGWADGSLLNLLDKCLVTGYGSKSAAGWTRSFTGTSKGVFRQGSGCQFYMRVLDDGSLTAGAREAQFYGGETASDVDTLTNLFPTAAQQSTFLKMRKSDTADTTHRDWVIYADDKTFYLFTAPTGAYYAAMMFGDFFSLKPGDTYNCMAIGRVTSASVDAATNETLDLCSFGSMSATTISGHYVCRAYSQVGTSVLVDMRSGAFSQYTTTAAMGNQTTLPFPNSPDGSFFLSRVWIIDTATQPVQHVRGYLRGFWGCQHTGSQVPLEYNFSGSGTLSGRTFKVLGGRTGNSPNGRYIMETSDTWD